MVSANNFTKGYAEALVLGTPKDQLAKPNEPKKKEGMMIRPQSVSLLLARPARTSMTFRPSVSWLSAKMTSGSCRRLRL